MRCLLFFAPLEPSDIHPALRLQPLPRQHKGCRAQNSTAITVTNSRPVFVQIFNIHQDADLLPAKPEDAPQPKVAAPAAESEPSLVLSAASIGATCSCFTSSAPPTEAADKSIQS
jgi:hypothetical protein